jgi:predicted enzyme related to lactoylglutathione lyase
MVGGVGKVGVDVEDQDRAKAFWTGTMGFDLVQDTPYGETERWLEVRPPDKGVILILGLRQGARPTAAHPMLPTSNVFFYADDLDRTYQELSGRGVVFPQPPVDQDFGRWSLFEDTEGNRFALVPRGQ